MIAIYARVSTEEQARNGYSLMDQIRACRRLAGSDDIIEYIDDGISGEILDRPELSRLRRDITLGLVEKVLCLDPDRLSRKLMNQLILSEEIERKAELLFVNGEYGQSAEGRLFYQLRGAISEFEKAKINERMSRGRREKARQGKVVRDYSIYGYNYDTSTQQLVINLFEAEIVRLIFMNFTCNNKEISGINGIARYLTELGIPTKRGAKEWHRQVIRQILTNRAYIGEFYQNRWNCEGMHINRFKEPKSRVALRSRPQDEWILISCPKIVDLELFSYTQQLMEESRRRWSGSLKSQYLLSGLVRCAVCGNTMTGKKSTNWGKTVFEYSDIKGTSGAKNRGCGNRIRSEKLDNFVWNTVLEQLKSNESISSFPVSDSIVPNISSIDHRLLEIKKSRNSLLNILILMSDEIGLAGLEDAKGKLKELQVEEEYLTNSRNCNSHNCDGAQNIDPFKEAWNHYVILENGKLEFDDKQSLIRHMVKEVIADADQIIIKGF